MANPYRPAADFRAELRRFLRRSEDCARANGLTPRQHLLLLQIAGSPEGVARISDLVGRLSLTQSAVTELVQRAEDAGLVDRTPSTVDGRAVDLSLSREGQRRLAAVYKALGVERQHLHAMMESLDRAEENRKDA